MTTPPAGLGLVTDGAQLRILTHDRTAYRTLHLHQMTAFCTAPNHILHLPHCISARSCRLFPAKRRMDGSLSWRPQRQTSNGFCLGSAAHTAQLCGHARLSSGSAVHTAQPRGHAHSSSGSAAIRPNRGHARPSLQHTAQARVTLAPARGTAQARGHARPSKSHLNWPDDSTTTSCLPFKQTTGNIAADLNFSSPTLNFLSPSPALPYPAHLSRSPSTHSTMDVDPHLFLLTDALNLGHGATFLQSHRRTQIWTRSHISPVLLKLTCFYLLTLFLLFINPFLY